MISLKDANIDMSKINISNTMDDIRKGTRRHVAFCNDGFD
jgi:hypothetical protein